MIARAPGSTQRQMQKQQTTAGGETLSFDYTFDIPVEVAAAVCKYRHDRWKFEWGKPQFTGSMSQSGQTRKSGDAITTSALPPTADIPESGCDVRKVSGRDSCTAAIFHSALVRMWMSVANYLRLVRGNTILNSVNCPGSVSTSMLPPCCFTNNGHSWAGSSKALGEVRGLLLSVVGERFEP